METIALMICLAMALVDGLGKWYTNIDLSRRRMRLADLDAQKDQLRRVRQELESKREKATLKQRELQNDCRSMAEDLSRVRGDIEELQNDEERIRGAHEGDGLG